MNKFLILTSITGGKNTLTDPIEKYDNCDFIAFVDKKYNVNIWEQRDIMLFSSIDQYKHRRNAKIYKILSTLMFPNYDYIIWHDGSHQLKVNPQNIINEYGDFDLLLFRHPERICLYQEIEVIKMISRDNRNVLDQQKQFYLNENMPTLYGLFEMSTFIRKNTNIIKTLDSMWWEQICKFSSRDQCSFTYCLWKLEKLLNIKTFKGFANFYAGGNQYFNQYGHHNHI